MTALDVSIVVCTYNRAESLRAALASLYDLATDDLFSYEVVVVDNVSTDHTRDVVAAAAGKSKRPVRYAYEAEQGIVAARNRGIREARGRWIAFFDDDQLADPRWLAELVRGATELGCRVVGGTVQLHFPAGPPGELHPAVRMLLGEAILADQPRTYGGRLTPGCGNLMIERTVFDEVGVFERTVHGRGEDTDLFSRIERAGIASWYIPTAVILHVTPPERLQTAYLLNLASRMGEGIAIRQLERLGKTRFWLLWLAKAARLALLQFPLLLAAWLRHDRAEWLGIRCLVAINARFLRAGWQRAKTNGETGESMQREATVPASSGPGTLSVPSTQYPVLSAAAATPGTPSTVTRRDTSLSL